MTEWFVNPESIVYKEADENGKGSYVQREIIRRCSNDVIVVRCQKESETFRLAESLKDRLNFPAELRDVEQFVKAHDLFNAIISGDITEFSNYAPEDVTGAIHVALDVPCWSLRHDHNQSFADNLRTIEKAVADLGYKAEEL